MSRHRNVRTMDYNDEYDGYEDVYGHSVDDENTLSPTDASQWIYDRARGQQSISAFMKNNRNIEEEDEEGEELSAKNEKSRRDSDNFRLPVLDEIEKVKLTSCIDEIRSVVGDAVSEQKIFEQAIKYNYDFSKTLDAILNEDEIKKKKNAEKDFKNHNTLIHLHTIEENKMKSNKLDDLIKQKLSTVTVNNSIKKSTFILPKLRSPSGNILSLKLPLPNLQSNMNAKLNSNLKDDITNLNKSIIDLKLSPIDSDRENLIDLSEALCAEKRTEIFNDIKKEEIFHIPYIGCDISLDMANIKIFESNILEHNYKFYKSKSNLARVLKLKYYCQKNNYIKHVFKAKSKLKTFDFQSMSPDDIILRHIDRRI